MSRSRHSDGVVGVDDTALMPYLYGTAFDRRRTKALVALETRVSEETGKKFRVRTTIAKAPDYVDLEKQRLLILLGSPGDFIDEIPERHIFLLCLVNYKENKSSEISVGSREGNGFIYIIDSQPKSIKFSSNVPKPIRDIAKYLGYREIVILKGRQEDSDCFSKCLSYVALALGGVKLEEHLPRAEGSYLIKIKREK